MVRPLRGRNGVWGKDPRAALRLPWAVFGDAFSVNEAVAGDRRVVAPPACSAILRGKRPFCPVFPAFRPCKGEMAGNFQGRPV
jgi:hypothetical protein